MLYTDEKSVMDEYHVKIHVIKPRIEKLETYTTFHPQV